MFLTPWKISLPWGAALFVFMHIKFQEGVSREKIIAFIIYTWQSHKSAGFLALAIVFLFDEFGYSASFTGCG